MKRPKGPELKMPELKAPAFLTNLFYDMRDRRLLPLAALVVVAIAATPFLLGRSSETEPPPAAAGAIAALRETSDRTSALTVVEATPGLRDYRKRLRGRRPTDPFRQLGGSGGSESGGGSTANSSESLTSTATTTTTESSSVTGGSTGTSPSPAPSGSATTSPAKEGGSGGGGAPSGGDDGGGDGGKQPHATLYSFAIDVTIVHSSGSKAERNKKTSEPETRTSVLPTTSLPGEKKQVVTYMGLSPKTRKPLFLVSTDVTGVFGEGKCVAGSGSCQLIELEPGFPEIFEYGEDSDRYSIKVTDVELVVTGHV
jgi:hypothetical protein